MKTFSLFFLVYFISYLVGCNSPKCNKSYKTALPKLTEVAVLTPYVHVEQLLRQNDFKYETPTPDTLKIRQGTQYIQHKTKRELPQQCKAYAINLSNDFINKSQEDTDLLLEQLEKKKLDKVNLPAYLREFLLKEQIKYAIILSYIGVYKTSLRDKQDELVYNANEALEGVFAATSPAIEPLYPNDTIGTLYFVLYDVGQDKILYYAKEINSELASPDVPIYPKAIDFQLESILKKLKKDLQ